MAIKHLDNFGKVSYDFTGNGGFAEFTNITKHIELKDVGKVSLYNKYIIREGERPDIISTKLYGKPDYYWIFFLINPHLREGLLAWPLDNAQFDSMIAEEYGPYCFIGGTIPNHNAEFPTQTVYSLLPLAEHYYNDIDIYLKISDSYVLTDYTIVKNDFQRMGLVLKRGSAQYLPFFGLNTENIQTLYFKPKDTTLGAEWLALVEDHGYPLNNDGYIPMEYHGKFSYNQLQNATYQYFRVEGEENYPVSHYDTVYDTIINGSEFSNRITFVDYERIINERKRYIVVPKLDAVNTITQEYTTLIQRQPVL